MKIQNPKINIRTCQYILIFILIFFGSLGLAEDSGAAGSMNLEIMNIKPSGTGSPAISEHNRIFKAYPGIEYNIRAAVMGGLYPYYYSLENSPSGMIIDMHTGEIKWTPTSEGIVNNIQLNVIDSEGTSVSSTWSINVTRSGFIFVDSSYQGTSAGTITQPYKSIQDILDYGATNDIVYFKNGTYNLPLYHSGASEWDYQGCRLDYNGGRPNKWISYPGENVIIDMNKHYLEAYAAGADNIYLDGLKFTNCLSGVLFSYSSADYFTARRCDFENLIQTKPGNNNFGFLYFTGLSEPIGYYKVFQDNKFYDYNSAAAIGSLYRCSKTLIEDNEFYNQTATGNSGIVAALTLKRELDYTFVRHNIFRNLASNCAALGHSVNAGLRFSNNTEISFNLFYHPESYVFPQLNSAENNQNMYFYRNTIVGGINIDYLDNEGFKPCGPYTFENNVIQNSVSGIEYDYDNGNIRAVEINNLKGTFGIVDSNGLLINRSYVGAYGWEIADDEYWEGSSDTTAPASPSGLSVS